MFSLAALVPSPPILVPELCGGTDSAGIDHPDHPDQRAVLRAAVLDVVCTFADVSDRWMVLGVGVADDVLGPETVGTFRGFGADLRVGLSSAAVAGPDEADPGLALPALIAGWLRGRTAPAAVAQARIVARDASPDHCAELGAQLRAELDVTDASVGVLVVADGAATLSTKAPGYLDERADAVQDALDRALTAGDRASIHALEPALCAELALSGRSAYQVLAGLFRADPVVETRYRDAPFGVGYHVSLWRPARDEVL
ncbi:hypothetical protein AB0C34_04385 [Nocardia sp. NPDC049220]|uniref:hypothetical protein n=1 Tax=Nocardia sp. NPDC049220 TaxID=3155273 RepID=UPI0033F75B90